MIQAVYTWKVWEVMMNFLIEQTASSKIKIKIRGGNGKDFYDLKGNVKSKVYDSAKENNRIAGASNAKFFFN